ENWQQAITLDIADAQRRFLDTPSVLYGIAEVQFHPTYTPYAICDDETVVGFVVYGYVPEDASKWWIPLILIDHRHQGKGYGRAAMEAIIQAVREQAPDCREIALSYKPDNTVAERLYLSVGFEKTDEVDDRGQVTMRMTFDPSEQRKKS
ncbi:MAG: GNAT family N-acetyltransferase, partial [Anaerolineae bacterium]|nr:GNAT family N-acetyltransferase [Anaerolineae bacterium]